MDPSVAEDRLRSMTAASSAPALTDAEVLELVMLAEARGWDLRFAAAEGWRWKAAKLAGQFPFTDGDQRFDLDRAHAQCLTMAQLYGSKRSGTVRLPSATAEFASVDLLRAF